ncbi:Eco29kI family restriction endonuclease [Pseudomonas huaxiensis]|uniref:Eco29kI family restriction endonuclease n=1 Tax=Pseudomonas huaxiensis TaxID=2213017 RepID=UPI000DA6D9CE|nr:Eco29kI family restriction endonuclease [Pseudomonas huaxiensis]
MAKDATDFQALLGELSTITDKLSETKPEGNARSIAKARQVLSGYAERLTEVAAGFDPILRPSSIFDPSDPQTAGRIVALTLISQPVHELSAIPNFYGAGIYAIYYKGDFAPYAKLVDSDHPIYVGKADPENASAKNAIAQGTKLAGRLAEHAKSIGKAETTLTIEDFKCRFLIVQSGFQKSAEDYLINFFKPIWNSETKICFGLGKHGDSSKTRDNKRSPWDTMHPGRAWADQSTKDQKTRDQIIAEIDQHLALHPPYVDIHELFDRFMEEMRQLNREEFKDERDEVFVIEEASGNYEVNS